MIVLVTKEQVIEKYPQGKTEVQELLELAIENVESEMIENLQTILF